MEGIGGVGIGVRGGVDEKGGGGRVEGRRERGWSSNGCVKYGKGEKKEGVK